jgi:hypothetical protein
LSAVAFVHDYVELHFDGRILRALTPPLVRSAGGTLRFPEQGSRDALCALIGRNVVNIVVQEGQHIEVRFDGYTCVELPLSVEGRPGPEAAHFVPGENQPMEVW